VKTPRWDDWWPGWYQRELAELRAAGIQFQVDEVMLAHRILRIEFTHVVHGVEVRGDAVYPDLYPDFRPAVQAEPLGLTHHQNPLGGNLCLLGRGGDRWRPSYTLAWLLTEQLPQVLASGNPDASREAVGLEDVQAEPYSAYLPRMPGSAILIDGRWEIPAEIQWGRLVVGTREPTLSTGAPRAAILEVKDGDGNVIATADPAIAELFPNRHHGRWARSDLSNPGDLQALVDGAVAQIREPARRSWPQVPSNQDDLRILGIVIPEEVAHRRGGQGWAFAVLWREKMTRKKRKKGGGKAPNPEIHIGFARPVYVGRDDLAVRVPELAALRTKTIALFGLGSLGAPAALEFARSGAGKLRVLDGDHVDAGPTVRWPFGLRDVGRNKVDVVHDFIREHYPYTEVQAVAQALGEPAALGRKADQHVLEEMLSGVDLVVDATANLNVQRMLSELALERKIPYVMVEARHGGWGGVVFRQLPEPGAACWYCLQHALQPSGGLENAPAAPVDGVQPRGCGDVTFTGTGFDMTTIALDAVRRAIGTLCSDSEGGYPDPPGNVAIISLRAEDGSPSAPTWSTSMLAPHPACHCSAAAA
jgi:molybdopterin/thiamine biosynthesis adenylyltransferase